MDLKIPYIQVTSKSTAFDGAKKIVPEALQKFGVKADVKCVDTDCLITAKGSGFEAKIKFEDQHAIVMLELGFLLKPLRGKILEVLEKQIKKVV